jgi:hypothetical protein
MIATDSWIYNTSSLVLPCSTHRIGTLAFGGRASKPGREDQSMVLVESRRYEVDVVVHEDGEG